MSGLNRKRGDVEKRMKNRVGALVERVEMMRKMGEEEGRKKGEIEGRIGEWGDRKFKIGVKVSKQKRINRDIRT